jgi:acetamidase/formamidase
LVLQAKNLRKNLEGLAPGDLISVDWCDASIGKSSGSGMAIDVPVRSWGVFIGVLGEKSKHIVLAQNSFKYSDGLFDIDYTAIPVSWTVNVVILGKGSVDVKTAGKLVNSFLLGGRRAFVKRTFQKSVKNHA